MPAISKVSLMSHGPNTIDDLTEMYLSQSVGALTTFANAAKKPNDHEQRVDDGPHEGITTCADQYPCCTEDGCCDAKCGACCIVLLIGGCACCCYVTHGFGGAWTYWPF